MEKGPVLSNGLFSQALQRHLFLYEPQDFPCENTHLILSRFHWQLRFFGPENKKLSCAEL